ncbi:hypothetical protein WN48_08026 [Eufriesea mexicana]|uniref:Uncharacterized protein n=1 Tax=Eufriesea mexicana TaxID=516756 RepID=A0A310SJ87_9HYME|nr:hypothetical protein WN48_08026 [Eufriesea mexicana]
MDSISPAGKSYKPLFAEAKRKILLHVSLFIGYFVTLLKHKQIDWQIFRLLCQQKTFSIVVEREFLSN